MAHASPKPERNQRRASMDDQSKGAALPTSVSGSAAEEFAPRCTVAICTRNRPQELERCLQAVSRVAYPHRDVLVVDNAPDDGRTREVASRWSAHYSVEPVVGLSRARNRAARLSEAEIIAYLDDDAVPEPGWLAAMVQEFKDPQVMIVVGRTAPISLATEAEKLCALAGGYDSRGDERRVVDRETPFWFEMTNFSGIGIGANMAIRRCAFELWPGFDERLGRGTVMNGAEEGHAFFSLVARGYRVVYTPHAVAQHPYPCTLDELHAEHKQAMAMAAGYATLLLLEERRYRGKTARYILKRIRGAPRPWLAGRPAQAPRILSRRETWLAWLRGPFLYLRSRRQRRQAEDHEVR